jgi:hypothetical protein
VSTQLPRRTVSELVVLYRLEPSIVDYYVEGSSDRVFIEYLVRGTRAKVREIDEIDVPAEAVNELGLDGGGARSRLMALAARWESEFGSSETPSILCIIDADFDYLLARVGTAQRFLRRTDYSCLEAYWFNELHVAKYLGFAFQGACTIKASELLEFLTPILKEIFFIRASNFILGLNLTWLDPISCCVNSESAVLFDRDLFMQRWLNKNASSSEQEVIEEKIRELRSRASVDVRYSMNGHDLVKLLAWVLRPFARRHRELAREEVVARMLAASVERHEVTSYPLLEEIVRIAEASK